MAAAAFDRLAPAAARSHPAHRGRHRRPVAGSHRRRLAHPAQREDDRPGAAGPGATAEALCRALGEALQPYGPTCVLTASGMRDAGAPALPAGATPGPFRRRWSTGSPSRKTSTASSSTWRIRPTTAWSDLAAAQRRPHPAGRRRPVTMPRRGPGKGRRSTRPMAPSPGGRWCCGTSSTANRCRDGGVAGAAQAGFSPARARRRAGRFRPARPGPRRARRRPRARRRRRPGLCAPGRLSRAVRSAARRSTGSAAPASAP